MCYCCHSSDTPTIPQPVRCWIYFTNLLQFFTLKKQTVERVKELILVEKYYLPKFVWCFTLKITCRSKFHKKGYFKSLQFIFSHLAERILKEMILKLNCTPLFRLLILAFFTKKRFIFFKVNRSIFSSFERFFFILKRSRHISSIV